MQKSINKTTVIIVLTIFLTISVGYALFSDTITIEGTATAQGNFDIEATCLTTIPEDVIVAADYGIDDYPSEGYNNEVCTVSDDKVTYSVSLEYPGAIKWYAIKLSNIGSIDAKHPESSFEDFSNVIVKTYNSETNELVSTAEVSGHFFNDEIGILWQKKDGNFINPSNLTEDDFAYIADTSDENNVSYLIRTGAGLYLITYAYWPNTDKYSKDGVYYKATQTIEFPFEQYTK